MADLTRITNDRRVRTFEFLLVGRRVYLIGRVPDDEPFDGRPVRIERLVVGRSRQPARLLRPFVAVFRYHDISHRCRRR